MDYHNTYYIAWFAKSPEPLGEPQFLSCISSDLHGTHILSLNVTLEKSVDQMNKSKCKPLGTHLNAPLVFSSNYI